MKAHITITDSDGSVLEGHVMLAPAGVARALQRATKPAKAKPVSRSAPAKLDFSKSDRAFMKTHAKGISGQRKFVLLVAYLAKGQVGKEVPLNDVSNR